MSSLCSLAALGMVTALGNSPDAMWPRVLAGDQSGLRSRKDLIPRRSLLVAEVAEALPPCPPALSRYACRNNALTLAAFRQIEPQVRRIMAEVGPERVAIGMGSSTSGIGAAETAVAVHVRTGLLPEAFDYAQAEFGGTAEFLAHYAGITGPSYTISTACSSGARAVASGRALLELGVCDAVVAGGTDSLCGLTAAGFSELQAVSETPSNPFSLNRNGLNLGEGSAVFLMTRDLGGVQLLGAGASSDAYHMSAPDPEGTGAELAMRNALSEAGVVAEDVCYVNLHGTGTALNDAMEARVVSRILGDQVFCSSTKPLVGHTLGASGAIELGICWLLLTRRRADMLDLPPHRWDGVRDPAMPSLRLVETGTRVRTPKRVVVLSNSFGFGGNNATLVIGQRERS
jgi:3-oxoacyl-[acyl-carrier-protein] synthase-1